MEKHQIEELRQKYIQNPPEGMTAKLVKYMSDSDLLDMHYFLTEDDDLDDGELDLAMPGANGLTLIQHIRNSTEDLATIPIMVLSACAFENDKQAALDAGASIFIPKPFKPSDIVKNVRQLTLTMAMRSS